jgi:hypothetical protein
MSLVHESSISMNEQPPQSVVPMYVIPVYHLTSGTSEIRFHVCGSLGLGKMRLPEQVHFAHDAPYSVLADEYTLSSQQRPYPAVTVCYVLSGEFPDEFSLLNLISLQAPAWSSFHILKCRPDV